MVFPDDGYLAEVRALCTKYNVLMCCDEIQAGFGRTGYLMAHHHDKIRPDMLVLGKALSGGMMPISGCVADDHIMNNIKPGDHGCTYGGNPLAMAVAHAAVKTLVEDGMVENSAKMGALLLAELRKIKSPLIKEVRGRGLMIAIEVDQGASIKVNSLNLVKQMREAGILSLHAKTHTVRLMPPLIISQEQVFEYVTAMEKAIRGLEKEN